jgi:hypothetical protein
MNERSVNRKDYLRYFEWLKTSDVPLEATLSSLSYSGFYNHACIIASENPQGTIQYMNKAAETINLYFEIIRGDAYPSLQFDITEIVYFPVEYLLNCVLNSKNTATYKPFAKNLLWYEECIGQKDGKKIYDYVELNLALAYLILEDNEKTKFHLERAKAAKSSRDSKGLIEIIEAILTQNADLFMTGLVAHLEWYNKDRDSRASICYPYSYLGMRYINLANEKGLYINIESQNILLELINPLPKNFVFEGIPEVHRALERLVNKKKGVLGKIKNIFN